MYFHEFYSLFRLVVLLLLLVSVNRVYFTIQLNLILLYYIFYFQPVILQPATIISNVFGSIACSIPVAILLFRKCTYIGFFNVFNVTIANLRFRVLLYILWYYVGFYAGCQFITLLLICLILSIIQQVIYLSYIIKQYPQQQETVMTLNQIDPYFDNKLLTINPSFLNYTPYAYTTNPQVFCFSGNAFSLQQKIHNLTAQQISNYKSLRINITGTQIKAYNNCFVILTIILGIIFVFPFFFICCNWWKTKVNQFFVVENQGYDALVQLVQKSQAKQLYLMVQDNFFNRSKAEVIVETIQKSTVKNFVFQNVVKGFDVDGKNYTNFLSYMRPIKSALIKSDVSWGNLVLL